MEESKAELEMARVHLAQLRGSGGGREGEVDTLTTELQQVRRGVSSTVKLNLAISPVLELYHPAILDGGQFLI